MTDMNNYPIWPGWETVQLIGRGSYGSVYEIERDVLGEKEKAAMKVIRIPQSDSDISDMYSEGYDDESITSTFNDHLKNIISEYTLMRKLNGSANVVNCDDVRYEQHVDGVGWDIFIKMELLKPMQDNLPSKITDDLVIKIGSDLCRALEQCKQFSIIHRDIKPQNIFLSPLGDYKLGDFGVAKTVEKTSRGTKIGTCKYMAPEIYKSEPYGTAADIYSLGLVLYWLLNERRLPFLPLPPEKLSFSIENQAHARRYGGEALPAPAHGSERLKQIVLKACAYDPKERYHSADEMLSDLKALGIVKNASDEMFDGYEEDETTISVWNYRSDVSGEISTDDSADNSQKRKRIIKICAISAVAAAILICGCLVIPKHSESDNGGSTMEPEPIQTAQPPVETPAISEQNDKTDEPIPDDISTEPEEALPVETNNLPEENTAYAPAGPSSKDLDAILTNIDYPSDTDYFDKYQTGCIQPSSGKSAVYGFLSYKQTAQKATTVSAGEKLTVLAGRDGRYCVILQSNNKACWVNEKYVVISGEQYVSAGSSNSNPVNGAPSAEDLDAIGTGIVYPQQEDYLDSYLSATLTPSEGRSSVYAYASYAKGDPLCTLDRGEALTVLARRNSRCCVIVERTQKAYWVNEKYVSVN